MSAATDSDDVLISAQMPERATPAPESFNRSAELPYQLRTADFSLALQDLYDFLFDVNSLLQSRDLPRLEDTVRPAVFSGIVSDMLSASLAKHSRVLRTNAFHNGHPDLVPGGRYPGDRVSSGADGVEVKATKGTGAVDAHGVRPGWLCVFRYEVDGVTQPAVERSPTLIREILLAKLEPADFRRNDRGELGTRTASANAAGLLKLRSNWVYRLPSRSP